MAYYASAKIDIENTAYGKKGKPFKLDSQRLHWANLLIKMTRLCILQG